MSDPVPVMNEIRSRWLKLIGGIPSRRPDPAASVLLEERGENYRKLKISLAGDVDYPDDRITAWLLLPDDAPRPLPAVLALHSTTCGCGKDLVIGEPDRTFPMTPGFRAMGESMIRNRAYGLDLVQAGYAVLAPDLYADGERVEPGHRPYEPIDFYRRYPEWSTVGKAVYDNMIAIDYLCSLPEIDAAKIGVIGHSLGGHSAVFLAGLDERVRATCTNGGCTVFAKYLEHWARTPLPEELVASQPPVYCYIPGFRPYMSHAEIANPVEFGDVMGLVAPRPLLYAGAIANLGTPGHLEVLEETWERAFELYTLCGAADALEYNIYPGTHDFPERARNFTVKWFDRVLRG